MFGNTRASRVCYWYTVRGKGVQRRWRDTERQLRVGIHCCSMEHTHTTV